MAKPDPYIPKGPDKAPSRTKQAFWENFNTLGLAGVVAASFALLNPLPLVAAMVAEAVYLLFVPDSQWYKDRVGSRYDKEIEERREKLKTAVFPTLDSDVQARFARLEAAREQINSQSFEGAKWFREVIRKLDYLMEKFLLFASKEVQFREYLYSVLGEAEEMGSSAPSGPAQNMMRHRVFARDADAEAFAINAVKEIVARYDAEGETIDENIARDDNLHNQAVLEKRKDILLRRKVYVARIGEILSNLLHQLRLIEDTFGLINDEIRARSPEQVLADIEDVVDSADVLTEALHEVSPFEEMKLKT